MKKFNFYNGAFAASTLLAILVIVAELAKPFKTLLAAVFSHHWIGKAVLITIAFAIFGFFYEKNIFGMDSKKLSWYSVLGSLIIIFLFFVIHYFTG